MSEAALMTIRDWGMRFRELAEAGPDMAERVAQAMKQDVVQAVKEQRSVDGTPWAPRKLTDSKGRMRRSVSSTEVLVHAAEHVTARGIGNVAVITLEGPDVFHHYGAGRSPRRAILPSGGIDKLGNAIRVGIVECCEEFMTRKGSHRNGRGYSWQPKAVMK